MRIIEAGLIRVRLPLRSPFRTSFGTELERDALLVRISTGEAIGWGECVAMARPLYSSEYVDAAEAVLRDFLLPMLDGREITAETVAEHLGPIQGHRMAKAALEAAVLDAQLKAAGVSLSSYLGGVRERVAAGVSVGIADSLPQLLETVGGFLEQGYGRIKLKIEPGWDLEPVYAVRREFGDEVPLQVDANTAYRRQDIPHLRRLDDANLLLVEQPFPADDLLAHAALARESRTPVCLDESVTSASVAAQAIELGSCSIINIKPGRVGGYLESRRIHDLARAHGVAVWCGGMLETGVGRAANLALASLPGFTLPGDLSASDRFYLEDITEPFRLVGGQVEVPRGHGIGVEPRGDTLAKMEQRSTKWLPQSL